MNCMIPGANIKVFSKAVQALSKISDEILIEAQNDHLQLICVNSAKTAFINYKFSDVFFSTYDVTVEDKELVACQVPMKSLLSIFKTKSPDKKLDYCKIELEKDATKIIFKLKYKNDIMMVHALNLVDYKSMTVKHSKDLTKGILSATGQFFMQILSNFQNSDSEISVEVSNNNVVLRNYDPGLKNAQIGLRSQITLNSNEFIQYNIVQDTIITVSLKPIRSAIQFAEFFNLNVSMHFNVGGKPIILFMRNPTFEVTYIMATLNTDGMTQSTVPSTPTVHQRQSLNVCNNHNISTEDQEILDSINWNDIEMDELQDKRIVASDNKSSKKKFIDLINEEMSSKSNNIVNGSESTFKGGIILKSIGNNISDNRINNVNENSQFSEFNMDDFNASPESPLAKKVKLVFRRCSEDTFRYTLLDLGREIAPNSDIDTDSDN